MICGAETAAAAAVRRLTAWATGTRVRELARVAMPQTQVCRRIYALRDSKMKTTREHRKDFRTLATAALLAVTSPLRATEQTRPILLPVR